MSALQEAIALLTECHINVDNSGLLKRITKFLVKAADLEVSANWQPVERYDSLVVKPKLALFRFEPVAPSNGRRGLMLGEHFELSRRFGSRNCTHFMVIPIIPKEQQ